MKTGWWKWSGDNRMVAVVKVETAVTEAEVMRGKLKSS
jgi:hypothetical protein